MLPSVSVITPSFNQARYLEQTIRSVLEQNYPRLDYFIMDGGSTDSSVEIIRRYENRLAGWVSEPDRGQADGINKGFQRATGEIVAWLNSDDVYQPGAIAQAVAALQANPSAALVYGDVLSIDENARPFNLQTFQPFSLTDLMAFNIISQPAVFMRRAALEQAGLLDPTYQLLLDHHLWLRMARLAPPLYLPQTLAAARYHAEAKNLARTADFGREAFRLVEWMRSAPEFSPLFAQNRRRILAGAHRLNAFYLLDGGFYADSLAAYARAFRYNPGVVLRESHRILYALTAPLGFSRLRGAYVGLRAWFRRR